MYILGATILASGLFFVAGQPVIGLYTWADSTQRSLVNLANYDLAVVAQADPNYPCNSVCGDNIKNPVDIPICTQCISTLYTADLSGDIYSYSSY